MQARWFVLTLVCVALIAAGQVLFKIAASQWRVDGWTLAAARSFLSVTMIAALVIYAFATLLWVYVLRSAPLTLAYPLFSLAFIVTPLVAHFAIGEPLSWRTFAGGALIVAGVLVSVS
jgi:undecaprenyl phosphate-alpha-L-ara4N flippase subunit ArnE